MDFETPFTVTPSWAVPRRRAVSRPVDGSYDATAQNGAVPAGPMWNCWEPHQSEETGNATGTRRLSWTTVAEAAAV